jgi:DNA-binding SARP family transcriptional activator
VAFIAAITLLALFWPELDTTRSREALNQAILISPQGTRRLRPGRSSSVAARENWESSWGLSGATPRLGFADHFEAKRYGEALDLYRGDLLPGLFTEEAGGFEEWVESERARLRSAAPRAAREVAESREREQSYTTAVISARRGRRIGGVGYERAVRELLALLDRLGDRAGAIHAYEEFVRRLARELEAEPAAETLAVVDEIRKRAVAHAFIASRGEIGDPFSAAFDVARRIGSLRRHPYRRTSSSTGGESFANWDAAEWPLSTWPSTSSTIATSR